MDERNTLGTLNEINSVDKLTSTPEPIALDEFLQELYHLHNPEAAVMGIHYLITPVPHSLSIWGPRKKLFLVFENLFYNDEFVLCRHNFLLFL